VLVNCAGYNKNGRLKKLSPIFFEEALTVNLAGTFRLTKSILPFMEEAVGHKTILNITSVVPFMGVDGTIAYSTSKAGLEGFTKTLSKELALKRITVNNLALGYFDTGMIEDVPANILDRIRRKIPLLRLGRYDDLDNIIPALVECEYLTGTTVHLNGGLY
jgi:3-oxoacyl-[acyl-carrier protein] reductase